MPYLTPPTFTAGAKISAAQLNTLAANQAYFYGLTQGITPGWNARKVTGWAETFDYQVEHRVQYFHWLLTWNNGGGGASFTWTLKYNGETVGSGTASGSSSTDQEITGVQDLTALITPPTVGTFYEVLLDVTPASVSAGNFFEFTLGYESESATP